MAGSVPSLQEQSIKALKRAVNLSTVLPILSHARARLFMHEVALHAEQFIIQTFDAMLDREGGDALREALDDEELYESLCAEARDRRLRVRALRTPGRVLDRLPSAEAAGSAGRSSDPVKDATSGAGTRVAASSVSKPALKVHPGTERADIPAAPALHDIVAARLSPPALPASSGLPAMPPSSRVGPAPLDAQLADRLEEARCQLSARLDDAHLGGPQGDGVDDGALAGGIAPASCQRALLEGVTQLKGGASVASPRLPNVYPYSSLVGGVLWPSDVDPAERQQHLSDADFEAVFKLTKPAYAQLPAWKRLSLTKQAQLF